MKEIITIKKDKETNVFVARCELPPIYSQGRTKTEALDAIEDAAKLFVKYLFSHRGTK